MNLTVKENGIRVANTSFKGTKIGVEQIRSSYERLLGEIGFIFVDRIEHRVRYVHGATTPIQESSLLVSWRGDSDVLWIERGGFSKEIIIWGEYDLHDFVSDVLKSVRDVWTEGAK
jgi:hypothetical protein